MSAKNDQIPFRYLVFYNSLLFIGWLLFLSWQITHGFVLDKISIIVLNCCQTLALLEIFHGYKKWVSTPVFTAFLQIASRLFVLFWINVLPDIDFLRFWKIDGLDIVTVAWSVTEMIRYRYYTMTLLNRDIQWLTFLRYTLFIVLYPLGVFGEGLIMFSVLKWNGWQIDFINIIVVMVMLSYLPFFPKLYGYMWKQRKKKLSDT